jgi:hypothetical protein
MKEAGPKNFVMSLVAEIPNLCCEQARLAVSTGNRTPAPAVSHLEAEKTRAALSNPSLRFVIF